MQKSKCQLSHVGRVKVAEAQVAGGTGTAAAGAGPRVGSRLEHLQGGVVLRGWQRGAVPPSITPLPIRTPVTTTRAPNADDFKGWGHRGAAPLSLSAGPWEGGARAGDTARRRGPYGGARGNPAGVAHSQLVG